MNDRSVGLLEQYDIEVLRTRKGRDAILCDTSRGSLIFKVYTGNPEKADAQNRLLQQIIATGKVQAEQIIASKEDALLVQDTDGTSYILKTWFEGKECNVYDRAECIEAVKLLAALHNAMEGIDTADLAVPVSMPLKEYEKRNRELVRVRKYLRRKSQKSLFEIYMTDSFDSFLEQAKRVSGKWHDYILLTDPPTEQSGLCHGDYQYHNIIKCDAQWCIVNFERCVRDNPIRDLYYFMRKLLEKSGWSISLGRELLNAYEQVRHISAYSYMDLYYRLSYPEKFWKIVNFYYNSGKAWIPEKNLEKLQKLLDQEEAKQKFLREIF